MSIRRRAAAAAFGICTLVAYVALPPQAADAATGAEHLTSDPVMETTTRAFGQRQFDAVFDGERWFVVWGEDRGGGADVMGARVEPDGTLLDGAGIVISTGVDESTLDRHTANPKVAVDADGQFLVVWIDPDSTASGNDIWGARVSAAGRVVDPVAIPIAAGITNDAKADVAWNGSVFLVTFLRDSTSVQAALVTPDATVTPVGEVMPNVGSPSVGAAGSTFLVVGSNVNGILGQRVSTNGTLLGHLIPISGDQPGAQSTPVVAGEPSEWIVAWSDERNGAGADIFAARLRTDGAVKDPAGIPVSTAAGPQLFPEIGIVGTTALVIWRDERDGEQDLFGAHVTNQGVASEADGIPISATPAAEVPGAVVEAPGSKHAVVYLRVVSEAPYGGALRGAVRTVGPK